jgi:hypothetical protein
MIFTVCDEKNNKKKKIVVFTMFLVWKSLVEKLKHQMQKKWEIEDSSVSEFQNVHVY